MSIPATLPDAILVLLLIVNVEIVVAVPADLKTCCYSPRIILVSQRDAKMHSLFLDYLRRLAQTTPSKARAYPF
jgi:hypothetical protein